MKVFYIRVLFIESDHRFIFGLPLGFRDAGHTILVTSSLNNLEQLLIHFKPTFTILMGWSIIHTDDNLSLISILLHKYHIPCIYWSTEDPTFTNLFSIPLVKRLSPDYVFTVSKEAIQAFETLGYPASYLPFGYQPSIFKPLTEYNQPKYAISLIGNAYPNVLNYDMNHYRQISLSLLLNPILEHNQKVDIWGSHWDKMQTFLTYAIPFAWQHGPIHYLKCNTIYNQSHIVLGLQNYKEDVLAMRTYEILGSGSLMLTSYNTKLLEYFNPGKDFIMIDSEESTMEHVNYYLRHPDEKLKFQLSARKSVSEHSYLYRALEIIKCLKPYVNIR